LPRAAWYSGEKWVAHRTRAKPHQASGGAVSAASGRLQVQDGPYAATKEQLGGTFVIDVPDLDAALAWAEQAPSVQWGAVEVRPTATHTVDGQWVEG
jgi:hypothetical protein